MTNVHFIRVRDGFVVEKGWTDTAAFAAKQPAGEYRQVTRQQHDSIKPGDPAPPA